MTIKKEQGLLSQADSLCYNIERGVNLLLAVHEAMTEGSGTAESFTDALFVAFEYLNDKQKVLRAVVDGLYSEMRNRP